MLLSCTFYLSFNRNCNELLRTCGTLPDAQIHHRISVHIHGLHSFDRGHSAITNTRVKAIDTGIRERRVRGRGEGKRYRVTPFENARCEEVADDVLISRGGLRRRACNKEFTHRGYATAGTRTHRTAPHRIHTRTHTHTAQARSTMPLLASAYNWVTESLLRAFSVRARRPAVRRAPTDPRKILRRDQPIIRRVTRRGVSRTPHARPSASRTTTTTRSRTTAAATTTTTRETEEHP